MGSIIQPILVEQLVSSTIPELQDAHDFLSVSGGEAMQQVADLKNVAVWGQSVKRVKVQIPAEGRPRLCTDAPDEHSLTEVYNQCATVERLLDALRWLESESSGWKGSIVLVCHPTNTSGPGIGTDLDFDLAIRSPSGELGCFEISDVSSTADGNFKEGKDLAKFGIMTEIKRGKFEPTGISSGGLPGRCFLVVSKEFSNRPRRVKHPWTVGPSATFFYNEVKDQRSTRVFEVIVNDRSS